MHPLVAFLVRLLVITAGLVFAASMLVVFTLLALLWVLRSTWLRLTGRPAMPFVVRFRAAEGFRRAYRAAPKAARKPAAADITDVEAKRVIPR